MGSRDVGRRGALGLLSIAGLARRADADPTLGRVARIVVGSAPGGGTDVVARMLAERLSGSYAEQVVVENRTGASTRLAVEAVKRAAPDGATMLLSPMPVMTLFPHTFPKTTRYDALVDFIPVATIGEIAYGWVVRSEHPAQDLADFIAWAKERNGFTFAPAAIGAPQHMLGVMLARQAGVEMTVVTYRGGAQLDLLGGRLDAYMSHMADVGTLAREGRSRLLAVSSPMRVPWAPQVKTFAEQGFPDLMATEAFCLLVPAGTPAPLVIALNAAVRDTLEQPVVVARLAQLEFTPLILSPEATAERIGTERERWGPIVQAVGFSADD
ncbi:tripartite tricarboxylate transporter substrate-binding protein [Roseomonas sp. CAU 1739]|uniref:Bug family tripartite tricarboxylate transporter substrate binding protein n=1 Tax=Roseomonas sp. CAU 1739 TaxID=3140364 RepID=UPI00325AFBA0